MITIAIAGSTHRTLLCTQKLHAHPFFEISWILTPQPKPQGRKQELTKNPLHQWAEEQGIQSFLLETKFDKTIHQKLTDPQLEKPDFLLVVDFGYWVPTWLMELPGKDTLNIHPSDLPRWRGSSPGQFVLLYGEKESAICLIKMTKKFDQGPVIHRLKFSIEPSWTQTEYYRYSFDQINRVLPEVITQYLHDKKAQEQQDKSPTPLARRLTKNDSFVDWTTLTASMKSKAVGAKKQKAITNSSQSPGLLTTMLVEAPLTKHPSILERACRAFSPWPVLWTTAPTPKDRRRLKIWKCHLENDIDNQQKLVLDEVQLEGKPKAKWNEIKNAVSEKAYSES